MKKYETSAGVKLTEEQCKLVASFERLMKKWDRNICINAIAGQLTLMLLGNTNQNQTSEMSDTGGFNPDNIIDSSNFNRILSDGGDW
jgi:hypothetical protein